MSQSRFLLVDANNISLRAAYGTKPLHDPEGVPTSCMFTTLRTIYRVASKVKSTRTLCFWDGGHSQYRQEVYPEYKERKGELTPERKTALSDWKLQKGLLKTYLPYLGVGSLEIQGCEADDLIYRISKSLAEADCKVTILTTDADFFQLVSKNCNIYNPSKDKTYEIEDVIEEFGVSPEQWVEYRCLTGDSSDNIRGIDGIGPKKASAILQEFQNLETFLKDCDSRLRSNKKLKKFEENAVNGFDIMERNMILMDLDALPSKEIPDDTLQEQFLQALELKPDMKAFQDACVKHRMFTIIEERTSWNSLWR